MDGLLRYAQLGVASGLRSMAGPSQLSRHLAELPDEEQPMGAVSSFLARDPVRETLQLATFGEMLADKLPSIPDRTNPGSLAGRVLFGALAGGVLAELRRESVGRGALIGAIGAVVGTYAGYHARRALTRHAGVPDLAVALCEDAVAITVARGALRP